MSAIRKVTFVGRSSRAAGSTQRWARDTWPFLAIGVPLAIGISVIGLWPGWAGTLGETAVATILIVVLFASGLILIREPEQVSTGVLLLAASASVWLSWSYLLPGPFPYLATAFSWIGLLLLGWVMLRYPADRLAGIDRWVFIAAVIDLLVLPLVDTTTSEPEWFGFSAGTPWLGFGMSRDMHELFRTGQQALLAVIAIAACVRLVAKYRSASAKEREAQSVVLVALGVAIAIGGGTAIVKSLGARGAYTDELDSVANAFFVLVPVAFLWLVVRTRLAERARAEAAVIPDAGSHNIGVLDGLLTPRERAVLQLLASGASNAAIQERLRVTPGSLERTIGSIYTKLSIPALPTVNRRVAAVLHWKRSTEVSKFDQS